MIPDNPMEMSCKYEKCMALTKCPKNSITNILTLLIFQMVIISSSYWAGILIASKDRTCCTISSSPRKSDSKVAIPECKKATSSPIIPFPNENDGKFVRFGDTKIPIES